MIIILSYIRNIMKYILYKKKYINGKKRRLYKKEGSNKLYLKHKGRMLSVVKYKKYMKKKEKKQKKGGGFFNRSLGTSLSIAKNRIGQVGPNLKKQSLQSRGVEFKNKATQYANQKVEKHNDKQRFLTHLKKEEQRRHDLAKYARVNAQNKAQAVAKHNAYMSRQRQGINLYRQMGNTSSPKRRY